MPKSKEFHGNCKNIKYSIILSFQNYSATWLGIDFQLECYNNVTLKIFIHSLIGENSNLCCDYKHIYKKIGFIVMPSKYNNVL